MVFYIESKKRFFIKRYFRGTFYRRLWFYVISEVILRYDFFICSSVTINIINYLAYLYIYYFLHKINHLMQS